jgi:hypothetical protein
LFAIESESAQQTARRLSLRRPQRNAAKNAKKNLPTLAEDARAGLSAKGWYT